MKTLLVYDNTGKIWVNISGDYAIPDGLPYIEAEIPTGYYAESVNLETKEPVLKEFPKSNTDMEIESLKAQQDATNEALLGLMDMIALQ